ncbi:MAG: hypothetical protein AB1726_09835 [Planctomycetota bacterium]
MPSESPLTRPLAALLLAGSAAMIVIGSSRTRQIRVENADELAELMAGIAPYEEIGERELLIDATFTGVVRRDGFLYSTYDRSQPLGKRACPT